MVKAVIHKGVGDTVKSQMSWWWCDDLGLPCCFRTWPTYCNWWNHEFSSTRKSSSVDALKLKCTRIIQQDSDPRQTNKSASKWYKENHHQGFGCFEMTLSKFDLKTDPDALEWPWKAVRAQQSSNTAQLNTSVKTSGPKLLHSSFKDSLHYFKCLIAVPALKAGTSSY